MTTLTANYEVKRKDGEIVDVPVKGSTTIYKGALVVDLGTGYASVGAEGSYTFLGVAVEKVDNSSGSDGDKSIRVYKTGSYLYNMASAAQTNLGVAAYLRDDNTVAASTTNSLLVGYIVDVVSSSTVRVRIDQATR